VREAVQAPPPNVEMKNERSCTCTSTRLPIRLGQGQICLLPIPKNYVVYAIISSDPDSLCSNS